MGRNLSPQPVVAALAAAVTLPGVRAIVPSALRHDIAEDLGATPTPLRLGQLSTPLVLASLRRPVAHRSTALEPTTSSQDASNV
jgi:hypothetical protein